MTRTTLTLALTLALAAPLAAQPAQPAPATATTATAATATTATTATTASADDAAETRGLFENVMRRQPSDVARVLALDPSLLNNDAYINGYPELAAFLRAHPEVQRSAPYFMNSFSYENHNRQSPIEDFLQAIAVLIGIGIAAFTFTWLVRTIIDQRRWNRLSKTQTDVHTKIMDRFSSAPELLEYMKTPAGSKFLESAPIALHVEQPPVTNAPMSRVLWSIQLGIIVATGALGMILVSGRLEKDANQALFTMGAIALAIGVGFILSAVVSMAISRRLGMMPAADVR